MSLKFKKLMTAQDIINFLKENCFYNDEKSDVHIVYNLYKNYEHKIFDDSNKLKLDLPCSYEDFCSLYKYYANIEAGEINDN